MPAWSTCTVCASIVTDSAVHTAWHALVDPPPDPPIDPPPEGGP